MIFAIHCEALKEALTTPDHERKVFFHSKISVTQKILEEYQSEIASDPILANYYYPFFQHISNKLKIINTTNNPETKTSILNDYFTAAQYGGKNLTISEKTTLHETEIKLCADTGIRVRSTSEILSDSGRLGYEPFEKHKLLHGKSKSPTIIEDFFKNEKHLIFYDKYINNNSISLINHLISKSAANSKSIIITSERASLSTDQIKEKLKKQPNQSIRIELADARTADLIHDRFIYIDKHYELHFPRGLDIFGCAPNWINQNATIDIYDIYNCGTTITIGFKKNGASIPNPIQVRSIING